MTADVNRPARWASLLYAAGGPVLLRPGFSGMPVDICGVIRTFRRPGHRARRFRCSPWATVVRSVRSISDLTVHVCLLLLGGASSEPSARQKAVSVTEALVRPAGICQSGEGYPARRETEEGCREDGIGDRILVRPVDRRRYGRRRQITVRLVEALLTGKAHSAEEWSGML